MAPGWQGACLLLGLILGRLLLKLVKPYFRLLDEAGYLLRHHLNLQLLAARIVECCQRCLRPKPTAGDASKLDPMTESRSNNLSLPSFK